MDKDEEIKQLRKQNEMLRRRIDKLEIENKILDDRYMQYATGEDFEKREREKLQKEYEKILKENKQLKEQCLNCAKIKVMAS